MQTAEMREKMFTIRMTEEETARLEGLAKHYGITSAGVIRMLVKRDADALERADVSTALATRAGAEAWMKASKEQGKAPAPTKAKSRAPRRS